MSFHFVLLVAILASPSLSRGAETCPERKGKIERECVRGLKSTEDYLQRCLVRRDTCQTGGAVSTGDRCQEIGHCMSDHEETFRDVNSDRFECNYYWNDVSESCHIRRGFLTIVSHCPGRTTLFDTIIGGFDGGIDKMFDCKAQAAVLEASLNRCQGLKAEFERECPALALREWSISDPDLLSRHLESRWGIEGIGSRNIEGSSRSHQRQMEQMQAQPEERPSSAVER